LEHHTDRRLVLAIIRGSLDAFAEMYDRHSAGCWQVARCQSADDASAGDAVVDTFAELWRRPEAYAGDQAKRQLTATAHRLAAARR